MNDDDKGTNEEELQQKTDTVLVKLAFENSFALPETITQAMSTFSEYRGKG